MAAPHDYVYAGQPLEAGRISISDADTTKTLEGDTVAIPKTPDGVVAVSKSAKAKKDDALTLNFDKAWYASLRVQAASRSICGLTWPRACWRWISAWTNWPAAACRSASAAATSASAACRM
jgi:hypothetical protein